MKTGMFIALSLCIAASTVQAKDKTPSAPKASGFTKVDKVVGKGALAVKGSQIKVHYVGTLTDGTKFDSSRDRGDPFLFTLGAGQVIRGWDEGFEGMKVGGKRILTIPPDMGYGSAQTGPIPANSTLVFEVELLEVLGSKSQSPKKGH